MGLEFSNIAHLMRELLLKQNRGVGGAKRNYLTRTLEQILHEKPDADRNYVIDYLRSEEALDSFHNTENPTVHVTNVEVDETSESLIYEDRARKRKNSSLNP